MRIRIQDKIYSVMQGCTTVHQLTYLRNTVIPRDLPSQKLINELTMCCDTKKAELLMIAEQQAKTRY